MKVITKHAEFNSSHMLLSSPWIHGLVNILTSQPDMKYLITYYQELCKSISVMLEKVRRKTDLQIYSDSNSQPWLLWESKETDSVA